MTLAVSALSPSGTNRSRSMSRSNTAEVSLTAPTAFHVVPPSVENSHVPLPRSRSVTAMPTKAPLSASLIDRPTIEEIVSPELSLASSVMVEKLGPKGVRTGASLPGATLSVAVSVEVLKALVPPEVLASTPESPLVPLLWSQARNVTSPAGPL